MHKKIFYFCEFCGLLFYCSHYYIKGRKQRAQKDKDASLPRNSKEKIKKGGNV